MSGKVRIVPVQEMVKGKSAKEKEQVKGSLRPWQKKAAKALKVARLRNINAPTGSGKTYPIQDDKGGKRAFT